ncbi:hypothetical protein GFB49_14680 [Epibacterium sp. SM1979]|uniref:Uncharacterized protein n=1 Tax=Tritonibacter litoralis TaxID=2662264 RepID=A0A843YE79_9RHOB|nr:hypothetical protein [Tritonibacter litoralis]MQQ09710.1 hypothetical protein [Tritonibacter litoralis]
MFLELLATILAGVGGAGVMMLVNKITGSRLPRWFTPVAAGLAMIGVTISNEYSWYSRTAGSLPEGMVVAETVENKAFFRPWTLAFPYVDRFVAVDTPNLRTHEGHPGLVLGDLYFYGRWSSIHKLPVLADCPGSRRAALADGIEFHADGRVTGADWVASTADDAVLTTICGGDHAT